MNYEIENEFLGNLLLKPNLMRQIVISEELLLDDKNKFIFSVLKKQYEDCNDINIVGIAENYRYLFSKYKVDEIINKLTVLINETMPINNINYYQDTMLSRYIKYKILEVVNDYKNEKISTEEMLNQIHKFERMSIKTEDGLKTADDIYELISSKSKRINLKFKKLSENVDIKEQDLVIIGARPGIGKTGFMLNLFESLSENYNCLFFSMEMSEVQIYKRIVSIRAKVPMTHLNDSKTEYQEEKIKEACKTVAERKTKVFLGRHSIMSIKRKISSESKNSHTLVFIDYVGLIDGKDKKQSTYEFLTDAVKELRRITLEFDCTIFLAAQLRRDADSDKDPKLSELKETGELEQSATQVIFLHDENHMKNNSKTTVEMSIIVAKNRDGKVGKTKLLYNKENQRFEEEQKWN